MHFDSYARFMRNDIRAAFPHLSRRGFLMAGAAGSVAFTPLRAFSATPGCALIGEQEEGPYYVDDETLRRNITEDKPGVPLQLAVMLVDAKTCKPLRDAALDIWHCDATGVYSGFTSMSPDGVPGGPAGGRGPGGGRGRGPGPGGPPPDFGGGGPGAPGGRGARQIDPTRFLRGVQLTDESGRVEFTTLYPGSVFRAGDPHPPEGAHWRDSCAEVCGRTCRANRAAFISRRYYLTHRTTGAVLQTARNPPDYSGGRRNLQSPAWRGVHVDDGTPGQDG